MRKICVVTGSRAEYGHLYWLMREIQADPECMLQVAVTGMHLSPEFGLTYQQVESDGFTIDAKIENLLSSDSPAGIAKSIGLGAIGFADAFERLSPDAVVLLGDRFETFAAAVSAMTARIPIAHIHGGETTQGLIDEAIRHAITKMAHLHFVSAEPHRSRVIQLGEDPLRVFNFGAPGLDAVKRLAKMPREALERALGIQFGRQNFLVTYHPVTLSKVNPEQPLRELLSALDQFPDAQVVFTQANADTNGRVINSVIEEYRQRHPGRTAVYSSLGQLNYMSLVSHVDLVIGNSSSGLIEVPAFGKPTVNVGDRQKGRLRARSVIDCRETTGEIVAAIAKGLSGAFRRDLAGVTSPYGDGNASPRIKEVLKTFDLEDIVMKRFHDIAFPE